MLAAGVVFSAGHISGTDAYAEELGVDTVQQETASDAADSTADETVSDTLGSTGDETASDTLGSTGDETAADVLGGTAGETASDSIADETASDTSGSTGDETASDTLGSTTSDAGKDTALDVSEEEVRNGWYEVDGATIIMWMMSRSGIRSWRWTECCMPPSGIMHWIPRAEISGITIPKTDPFSGMHGISRWRTELRPGSITGMTAANITDTRRSRERIITLIHIPGS